VEYIQGRLADGRTNEMLLASFPSPKPEHIQAVHAFVLGCLVDVMLTWPLPGKFGMKFLADENFKPLRGERHSGSNAG